MADYHSLVAHLIDEVGGAENIKSATHCATRLRLNLINSTLADEAKVKEENGVLGVVKRDHEFQIVIGPDVPKVYSIFTEELDKRGNASNVSSQPMTSSSFNLKSIGKSVVDFVSGTFVPVLPILVAAGLVSAVLNIAETFFHLPATSGTVVILTAINTAGFYFLPIFLGGSAAKKLGIDTMMGQFLGAVLLVSTIDGVKNLNFLGIHIPTITYHQTTVPVILGVLFMALLDKFLDKWILKEIKFFVKPLIVMIITVPITLWILGPLGYEVGEVIANILSAMHGSLGWVAVAVMAMLTPLLVLTGTNQALFPLVFAMLAEYKYDSFVMPAMLAANTAVGAAALAIALKEKSADKKGLALSAGITGVMGITEPSIFGVLINYRSAFLGAIAGAGIGGIIAGLVSLKQYAVVSPGLAAIPTFIPTDGSGLSSNFWFSILVILISVVCSFSFTLILQSREQNKNILTSKAPTDEALYAPVAGQVIQLEKVSDPVFSGKMMGEGFAVEPTGGNIAAPISGKVSLVQGHAIGLVRNDGLEVLLHIGLDTVNLNGTPFTLNVKVGDFVKGGQIVGEVDWSKIEQAGLKKTVIVVFTNTADKLKDFAVKYAEVGLSNQIGSAEVK